MAALVLHEGALAPGLYSFPVTAPAGAVRFRLAMTRLAWPQAALVSLRVTRDADGSLVGGWETIGGDLIDHRTGAPLSESWGEHPAPGGAALPVNVGVTIHVVVAGAPIETALRFEAF